jgi:myxalamid-type polyketide synthase MxaB
MTVPYDLKDADADIAVIGMSGRFPGARNLTEFWSNIANGVESVSRLTDAELAAAGVPEAIRRSPDYVPVSSRLEDVDRFDAEFFGYSPREAALLDPQGRLCLELAWHALEDAGHDPGAHDGSIGVFAAASLSTYLLQNLNGRLDDQDFVLGLGNIPVVLGNGPDFIATRVSYKLNLRGPSQAVQSACSSSLMAIHLARQSLLNGECDMALAGGVSIYLPQDRGYQWRDGMILSSDGHCRAFDADADGVLFGRGGGIVVLKTVAQALEDGDRIRAIIKGSAVNNDGSRKVGFTAPSVVGQSRVITEAMADAGVRADSISYIEAHGTGTTLGDPIEIAGLTEAHRKHTKRTGYCAIGTVKTNIGHLDVAAGVTALIKTVLMLEHRQLAPSLNYTKPNPAIDFASGPFYVNATLRPWEGINGLRRAGVSSFGIGGTNVHVILDEANVPAPQRSGLARGPRLMRVTARSGEALTQLASNFANVLHGADAPSLDDACFTANTGRAHQQHRLVVRGTTIEELRDGFSAVGRGEKHPKAVRGTGDPVDAPVVAFLFAGSGAQVVRMGENLYRNEPVFRAAIDRCDALLRPLQPRSLLEVLYPSDGAESPIDETTYAQPAIFAYEYALAELWKSWGVRPAAVLGHSLGEYAAACVSGLIPLEQAIRLVARRAQLIDASPHGAMAAVMAPEPVVRDVLRVDGDRVSIASINGDRSQVISGPTEDVARVVAVFAQRQIEVKPLNVTQAFHSSLLDSMLDEYERVVATASFGRSTIPLISNLTADTLSDIEGSSVRYWRRHTREPARWADCVRALHDRGIRHFVEIGPHTTVSSMAAGCLPEGSATFIASQRKGRDEYDQLFDALSSLYVRGVEIDWSAFHADRPGRRTAMPLYPFARTRHWIDARSDARRPSAAEIEDGRPLLGAAIESPLVQVPAYEMRMDRSQPRFLDDHRVLGAVVYPATAYVEAAIEAATAASGHRVVVVEDIEIAEPLILGDDTTPRAQIVLRPDGAGFAFEVFSRESDSSAPGGWTRHVSGRASADLSTTNVSSEALDIAAVRARCAIEISGSQFYDALVAQGFEYGPTFRGVHQIWRGDHEVLGEIRLADAIESEAGGYLFHPALLDACLQPSIALAPADRSFVPVRFERLALHAWEPHLYVHIVRRQGIDDPRAIISDARIANARGEILARVDGIVQYEAVMGRWKGTRHLERWFYEPKWIATESAPSAARGTGRRVLIVRGEGLERAVRFGARVEEQLRNADLTVASVSYAALIADPVGVIRTAERVAPLDAVVIIGSNGGHSRGPTMLDAMHSALAVARELVAASGERTPRLWLVTRNAQCVNAGDSVDGVTDATLWGFANVVSLEHPELCCACIDVDRDDDLTAAAVTAEVLADAAESRIAVRGGATRYVERVVRAKRLGDVTARHTLRRVEASETRTLDQLRYVEAPRRAPGRGEVEILVRATGLNFKDVLIALGRYPDLTVPLGGECAGEIVAVGDAVQGFTVGDAVVAFGRSMLATHAIADARVVAHKPASLSFDEAATIAGGFLTTRYGLEVLAKVGPDDRVLIHAATGGVGLAAVQIAQRAGATIFATAGSDVKRSMLTALGIQHVFSSRDTEFADAIMRVTDGRGVTVVLNSLIGDMFERSVDVLADGGRFVELGVTGTPSAKASERLARHASYFNPNIASLVASAPELLGAVLRETLADISRGELSPLVLESFAANDVVSAFRLMSRAGHVGKIVVRQNADVPLGDSRGVGIHADGSYLIVGGLGGLGLLMVDWLVQRGARHVAIMARRGPAPAETARINSITAHGANVSVLGGDVTSRADVDAVLSRMSETMPPLRGVFHAAGVLADAALSQQTWKGFETVLAPKVAGAWALHEALQDRDIDFLVLFSSIASLFGSKGQANYAAANAYLDGLAAYRRARGAPAVSVNWGPWSTVGMAASRGIAARVAASGLREIAPEQGVAALDALLGWSRPQVGVVSVDWSVYAKQFVDSHVPAMLSGLSHEVGAAVASSAPRASAEKIELTLADRVRAVSIGERIDVVHEYLRGHVAIVLGLAPNAHVDPNAPLVGMGLDSLLAVELRNSLNRSVGVSQHLPATLLFSYPTIATLGAHVLGLIVAAIPVVESAPPARSAAGGSVGSAASAPDADAIRALDELTDEEAEALLLEELE